MDFDSRDFVEFDWNSGGISRVGESHTNRVVNCWSRKGRNHSSFIRTKLEIILDSNECSMDGAPTKNVRIAHCAERSNNVLHYDHARSREWGATPQIFHQNIYISESEMMSVKLGVDVIWLTHHLRDNTSWRPRKLLLPSSTSQATGF